MAAFPTSQKAYFTHHTNVRFGSFAPYSPPGVPGWLSNVPARFGFEFKPFGFGGVLDVEVGQIAGTEMRDVEEHVFTGVDA